MTWLSTRNWFLGCGFASSDKCRGLLLLLPKSAFCSVLSKFSGDIRIRESRLKLTKKNLIEYFGLKSLHKSLWSYKYRRFRKVRYNRVHYIPTDEMLNLFYVKCKRFYCFKKWLLEWFLFLFFCLQTHLSDKFLLDEK